jgi:pyruvate,water dikinase
VPLHAVPDDQPNRYGGKAANLARMLRWGLPVPDGFAVAFLRDDPIQLLETEERAILRAYRDLGGTAVAVRSSAVGEDAEAASYAGQYKTLLNVVGDAAVLHAVRQCADSLRGRRVEAYRDHAGAPAAGMGVIIQPMVPAAYSGICFTAAPGAEQLICIEMARGLGESLVSGQRRPSRIRLRRDDLAVSELDDQAGVLVEIGEEAIRSVARLGLDAERRFGHPLDIEWSWAGGRCLLMQARPLTARHVDSEREQIRRDEIGRLRSLAGGRSVLWTDCLAADMLTSSAPLTLDLLAHASTYEGGIGRAFREIGFRYARSEPHSPFFDTICGHPVVNVGRMISALAADLPLAVDIKPARTAALDPTSPPLTVDWRRWWLLPWVPVAILRWLLVVPRRFFAMRRRLHREFTEAIGPALRKEATQHRSRDLSRLTSEELWDLFRSYWERVAGDLVCHHQVADIMTMGTRELLQRSLRMLYGDRSDEMESRLTTGIDGNFNTECNLALARVARGQLSLDGFLDEYGQRGNPDWDLATPRWREDPSRVKRMAAKIARSPVDALAQYKRQRARRRDAEKQLSADLDRHWWLRFWRRSVRRNLDHLQRYSPLREETQGVLYLWVELLRQVVLEAARRIGAGELLFYLTYDELQRVMLSPEWLNELLERARARRRTLAIARGIYVPHVIRSDDLDAIGRAPAPDPSVRELRGLVVSSGVVRGPARVVSGLHEAEDLRPGDILVASYTDPAWTPLFFVAGGLVLEQGGVLSHGAIVAREIGLPAVVNVPDATLVIKTGQEIVVDGTRGRVTCVSSAVPMDGA